MSKDIKNIVFDVGYVLVNFRWREAMADMGFDSETIEQLGARMVHNPLWRELDRGVMPLEEIIAGFRSAAPEYAGEIDRFWQDVSGLVRPYDFSEEWLRGLHERGYKIYLLSNYSEIMWNLHSKGFGFLKFTDGMIISYDVKLIKPDREIYNALTDKYGLDPAESVFLDDMPENTAAARELGFSTVTVGKHSEAAAELERLLAQRRAEAK